MATRYHYEPLVDELRAIVRQLRLDDPKDSSLRKWAAKLNKETQLNLSFRQIPRIEQGPEKNVFSVDYAIACALVSGVEIVIGPQPRILEGGLGGQARDLIRALRLHAAQNPAIKAEEVNHIQNRLIRTLKSG